MTAHDGCIEIDRRRDALPGVDVTGAMLEVIDHLASHAQTMRLEQLNGLLEGVMRALLGHARRYAGLHWIYGSGYIEILDLPFASGGG